MSSLSLFAGPGALAKLQEQGVRPELFSMLAGASGGPKWFVLYGLDRYLFGEFFKARQRPLLTLGSSVGAWRMSCLANRDPVAAVDRLAELYSQERYSDRPDSAEVTRKARKLLHNVLGDDGADDLVTNPHFLTHIIADRCRGVVGLPNRLALGSGLLLAAISNLVNRKLLSLYFERLIFCHQDGGFISLPDMPTVSVPLTVDNVFDALLASGSVPFALDGVRDICGAPPGLCLDGGISDYHFNLPFQESDGLVLYPHFFPRLIPGWFDKRLNWRKVSLVYYDNVFLVVPSREFVASLPYGKIPDRGDFTRMDFETRFKYWRTVMSLGERLADDFSALVESGAGLHSIQPLIPGQNH